MINGYFAVRCRWSATCPELGFCGRLAIGFRLSVFAVKPTGVFFTTQSSLCSVIEMFPPDCPDRHFQLFSLQIWAAFVDFHFRPGAALVPLQFPSAVAVLVQTRSVGVQSFLVIVFAPFRTTFGETQSLRRSLSQWRVASARLSTDHLDRGQSSPPLSLLWQWPRCLVGSQCRDRNCNRKLSATWRPWSIPFVPFYSLFTFWGSELFGVLVLLAILSARECSSLLTCDGLGKWDPSQICEWAHRYPFLWLSSLVRSIWFGSWGPGQRERRFRPTSLWLTMWAQLFRPDSYSLALRAQ